METIPPLTTAPATLAALHPMLQIKRSTFGDRIKRCGSSVAVTSTAEPEPLSASITEAAETSAP